MSTNEPLDSAVIRKRYTRWTPQRLSLALLALASVGTCAPSQLCGQGSGLESSVGLGYTQLADPANHGFLLTGADLGGDLLRRFRLGDGELAVGVALSGGGKRIADSWAFRWYFQPLDLSYTRVVMRDRLGRSKLRLGPRLTGSYDAQVYPDLHAGTLRWITRFGLGIDGSLRVSDAVFVDIRSLLLSATSRPPHAEDPHRFRVSAGEIISRMHEDLTLSGPPGHSSGSVTVRVRLPGGRDGGYVFSWLRHRSGASLTRVSHGLRFSLALRRAR